MPGDERDEIGSPDDGRGQGRPPRLEVTFIPEGWLPDQPTFRAIEAAVQEGKRNAHPTFFGGEP